MPLVSTRKLLLLILSITCATAMCAQQNGPTIKQSNEASIKRSPTIAQSIDSFFLRPLPVQSLKNTKTKSSRIVLAKQFDYPLDSCFTNTFKLKTGEATGKIYITESYAAMNESVFITGYIVDASGKRNGLLQLMDPGGNIAWSRSFEHPAKNTVFQSVRQLENGNLTLIGTTELANGTDKNILIVETDQSGNIQWSKTLLYAGYSGKGIAPTKSNGIGFTGSDDSTLVYGKLDYNGNLIFLRRMRLMERGAVVAMSKYDYNAWYIAYSGIDTSRRVSMLVAINSFDGAVNWINKFGGQADNSDFIFHDLETSNIRPRVTGIYSRNNVPYRLFNLTVNGTSYGETLYTYDIPGVVFDITAKSSITPWYEVIAFSPAASDPDVYAFRFINESYPVPTFPWAKKFPIAGTHELVNVERGYDGGYLVSSNISSATNTSQGYFLKADSTGLIKDCEGIDYALQVSGASNFLVESFVPLLSNPPAGLVNDILAVSDLNLPATTECKTLTCPVQPPEDSCLASFTRGYRGAGYADIGTSMTINDQNEIDIVGLTRDNAYDAEKEEGFILKVNAKGRLIQRKKINISRGTTFLNIIHTNDGNLLTLGYTTFPSPVTGNDTGYITITKFTPDHNFIWNKSFPFFGPYSSFDNLIEGADGSIFLSYIEGTNVFCQKAGLMKLNSVGDLIWAKDFEPGTGCIIGQIGSTTQDADHLYIMLDDYPTGCLLRKVNKNTGAIVWTKGFAIPGATNIDVVRDLSFLGINLVVQGTADINGASMDIVMIIDINGTLKQVKALRLNGYAMGLKMAVTKNVQLVFTGAHYYGSLFIRLDSNLNLLISKQLSTPLSYSRAVTEGSDGSIYDLGYFPNVDPYKVDIALKKYSHDGLLGTCFADTMILTTEMPTVTTTSYSGISPNRTVSLYSLPFSEKSYSLQHNRLLCSQVSTCNDLKLQAPTGICDTLEHTISGIRNPGCNVPVYFSYDNDIIKIVRRTDSTLIIKFKQSGVIKLKAKIFTGCRWIEDSTTIGATVAFAKLDLGMDTILCPSNTILLNAGKGFISYKWQDGSSDSVFLVSAPGRYYVDVTDACGNTLSDTVAVSASPPIQLSIGPDRIKCNTDTLHLSATAGFINYTWGPDYAINVKTGSSVIIQPGIDTVYFVKAEKTKGCFAYDTVRIAVKTSPPINIGPDKSFCYGDSITLDAGGGFAQYSWTNGSQSQRLTVKAEGLYVVTGTTTDGCKSSDTMRVAQVWPEPAITFNKDSSICAGDTRQLEPGIFKSYLWHDGSSSPNYLVSGAGIYYVTVTDNNLCSATDTVRITKILPQPFSFLSPDTVICSYGKLELTPMKNFNRYFWSTGEMSKSITIDKAGLYQLEVTDSYGCDGKDTVAVSLKTDCLQGFYIPSAFTPDNNGRNDYYKPIIGGSVNQYEFTIYNRWGEVVFHSRELNKGWDGTFKGNSQETAVFIWTCRYQVTGGSVKYEKGTCTLIR